MRSATHRPDGSSVGLFALGALASLSLWLAFCGREPAVGQSAPQSLGHALYQSNHTQCVAPADRYFDPTAPVSEKYARGAYNPNSAVIDQRPAAPPNLQARCAWDKPTKGMMVGPEGTSLAAVQAAIDARCGVLGALMPVGYVAGGLDLWDAQHVRGRQSSVWEDYVVPCQPRPTSTPRPTPSPTPRPTATPPPPVATPTPCRSPCLALDPGGCYCPPAPVVCPACLPAPACATCKPQPLTCLDYSDAVKLTMLRVRQGRKPDEARLIQAVEEANARRGCCVGCK